MQDTLCISRSGVFNLLSSRANLHLSYNPAGRSHCRLQNHHGYIKHHHRGIGGSPNSPTLTWLHLHYSLFSNPSIALPTSQLILQSFRCFTYVIGTSPTSHLILQPFRRLTYVTAHSLTLPSLYLRHSSFSNPSVASPTSQFILQSLFPFSYLKSFSLNSPGELILQPFHHFTYVTTHSPTLPSLYLRHSSFSNPSVASPTSQSIPHSLLSLLLSLKLFT